MKKFLLSMLLSQIICSGCLYSQLAEAVSENDIEKARELIQNGADVNEKDEYDFYALYWAQYYSLYDLEQELLDLGAVDYNAQLEEFFNSCESGDLEMVKEMVEQEQDVNVRRVWCAEENEGGGCYHCYETAICPAVRSGNLELVTYLISAGISLDIDNNGMQPLYEALSNDDYDMADYLIDQGASVNTDFILNYSYYDLVGDDKVMLYYLMEKGFTYSYSANGSPLITAAENSDLFMLKRYVELSQNTEEISVALCYATTKEIAEYLLNYGANIDYEYEDYEGEGGCYDFLTPLISAVVYEDPEYVNYILSQGADVNSLDQYADSNNYGMTECDIMSPLVYAVKSGDIEIAEILVNHGANVNWLFNSPWQGYRSPLIVATQNDNESIVQFLLENGAEVVLGEVSALDYTTPETSKEIIKLLEKAKEKSSM